MYGFFNYEFAGTAGARIPSYFSFMDDASNSLDAPPSGPLATTRLLGQEFPSNEDFGGRDFEGHMFQKVYLPDRSTATPANYDDPMEDEHASVASNMQSIGSGHSVLPKGASFSEKLYR